MIDIKSLSPKQKIQNHTKSVNSIAFSPDDGLLSAGGQDAHLSGVVIDDVKKAYRLPAHHFAIYDSKFSPDGSLLATCSQDKSIKIWDPFKPKLLKVIDKERSNGHLFSVNALLWLKHENILVSASDDRTIKTWKLEKTEKLN